MLFRSLSITLLFFVAAKGQGEDTLSFNRDIRPILSDKCFHCHGPDKATREADLRLDTREGALENEAIVPGDVKASEVYWRVISDDEDELMPPPEVNKQLTEAEKKTLQKWIEQGAEYEAHWSYLTIDSSKAKASIDEIVDEKLEKEGLVRSSRADDATLLRRLHFDITGLPPAAEDLKRFQNVGISSYVESLLESPHFGERMAIEWLDAVRYADSVGYHGDQLIEVSPFRDWVINAFNDNMPFDQFTIEQVAGDLLPDATIDQQVAASFNRLGQSSSEGGIQDAEYIAKYQSERVRTTSTAWLGTTLACAECHDHKFDPYTAKDFYQFAAFFADILEKGAWTGDGSYQEDTKPYMREGLRFTGRGPALEVPSEEQKNKIVSITAELKTARAKLNETTPGLEAEALAWAEEQKIAFENDPPSDFVLLEDKGESEDVDTGGAAFVTKKDGPVFSGSVSRKQSSEGLVQHIVKPKGEAFTVSDGDELYAYVYLDSDNPPRQVMLQFHHEKEGWNHRAWWGENLIPYGKGSNGPRHFHRGDLPETGKWVRLSVSVSDLGLEAGDPLSQFAFTQFGGLAFWDQSGVLTGNDKYQWGQFSDAAREVIKKSSSEWSDDDKKVLLSTYREFSEELKPQRDAISKLNQDLAAVKSSIRTVPATVSAKPREIRILPRGNWMDKSGELVKPGTPHFLPGHIEGDLTRLDLANWIVSPENPLTARTFVNRLWARFFGTGISNAIEDLGSQGEWPSHPELLDTLAARFVESGWDMKELVRMIVLSETYQQSSDSSPDLQERDPYNRLLARQSAIRLPAELIRDNALAVSGLLNPKIGGRSVRPYQPAGYYQHLNFPRRTYKPDGIEEQYRRGVYTHWQRTFLHPAMKAFDAPSREECTMEREHSSTPLQALVLLNDPSFVEAAKVLAEEKRSIPVMFSEALTRAPLPEEVVLLEKLYESEKKRFEKESNYADALVEIGLKLPAEETDRVELAARTSVARAILNLHEFITRY